MLEIFKLLLFYSCAGAKDYKRAILEFKNAAQALPTDAETHSQLGLTYTAAGDVRSSQRIPGHN
jgi:Flp pilus assembly protein TadD